MRLTYADKQQLFILFLSLRSRETFTFSNGHNEIWTTALVSDGWLHKWHSPNLLLVLPGKTRVNANILDHDAGISKKLIKRAGQRRCPKATQSHYSAATLSCTPVLILFNIISHSWKKDPICWEEEVDHEMLHLGVALELALDSLATVLQEKLEGTNIPEIRKKYEQSYV